MSVALPSARTGGRPDYGVDAPNVLRNLFLFGALCMLLLFITPAWLQLGPVRLQWHSMLAWTGSFLLAQGFLFLLYVKFGKFRHRDFMLRMHPWQGSERVLDVGAAAAYCWWAWPGVSPRPRKGVTRPGSTSGPTWIWAETPLRLRDAISNLRVWQTVAAS